MKPFVLLFALVAISFVNVKSQTQAAVPDSDPVLQGTMNYALPQSAVEAEIGGKVSVGIRVDKTGKPLQAVVLAGPAWPCSTTPSAALNAFIADVSEAMLKLHFTPAVKGGVAIEKNVGLRFKLKNPKLIPKAPEIDPTTGKTITGTITGGNLNGKAVSLSKPLYPADAKAKLDKGKVNIEILIGEDGTVLRAGAVDGALTLQLAARAAACDARFNPTLLNGRPVQVEGTLAYNFMP